MEAASISLLVQFAIKFGIPAVLQIAALFQKKDATLEDVTLAFSRAHKAYEDFEALPPGSAVPPLPTDSTMPPLPPPLPPFPTVA